MRTGTNAAIIHGYSVVQVFPYPLGSLVLVSNTKLNNLVETTSHVYIDLHKESCRDRRKRDSLLGAFAWPWNALGNGNT
jgi:hypothetical protein